MTNLDPYLAVYFITFVVLILLEVPIAYAMLASAFEFIVFNHQSFVMFAQKTANSLADFNMLALPAFLFVGCFMNEVGLTDRLFGMFEKWIGHLPGGLAHANVLSSMVFAGMSGSALADAGGLGTIEVSAMSKAGYDPDFSVAVTAASDYSAVHQLRCLGILKPDLHTGYVPGWYGTGCPDGRGHDDLDSDCSENPAHCLPAGTEGILGRAIPLSVYITSGTGWPGYPGTWHYDRCSVVAAMYCVILAICLKRFSFKMLTKALKDTLASAGMSMCLCATGLVFNWVIVTSGLIGFMTTLLMSLGNKIIILLVLNAMLLFLGCFIGSMQILIMVAPLLMNLATALGMSYVQMGVMAVLNVTLGLITPPMAPALFVTAKATGNKFETALKYTVQFLIPMFITLMITTFWEPLTMFLPRLLGSM